MRDSAYRSVQKSSEFRSSIHELCQDDGAQILLERPSHLLLVGVYGLFVGLLVALAWAWLARTDSAVRVRGELKPTGPVYAIASPFNGELVDLYATAGMPVKKGDIIARVRSPELLTKTVDDLRARIDLLEAEKAYALVRQAGSIQEERAVSEGREDRPMQETKLQLDLAKLRVMTNTVAPNQLDNEGALRLFSPIDGFVVEAFNAYPQAQVAAHQPLAKITTTRNLSFYMEVPERERWRLREGLPARIKLDALADQKHRILNGVLAYLSQIPEASVWGTESVYPGRVDIHASEDELSHGPIRLNHGMRGKADILLETPHLTDLLF